MSVDTNKPKKVVMMQGGLPCLGVGPRPPRKITFPESDQDSEINIPTMREIVAALAGELMSAAIRVSATDKNLGVEVAYNAAGDYLDVIAGTHIETFVDLPIYLDEEEAAEQIHCLIMKVEALGEVSG